MEKQYKKLSVDFPLEEYTYLKMMCLKKGVSLKDFVTKSVIRSVEDLEDEFDTETMGRARKEIAESGAITWQELEKKLGWDKL